MLIRYAYPFRVRNQVKNSMEGANSVGRVGRGWGWRRGNWLSQVIFGFQVTRGAKGGCKSRASVKKPLGRPASERVYL